MSFEDETNDASAPVDPYEDMMRTIRRATEERRRNIERSLPARRDATQPEDDHERRYP